MNELTMMKKIWMGIMQRRIWLLVVFGFWVISLSEDLSNWYIAYHQVPDIGKLQQATVRVEVITSRKDMGQIYMFKFDGGQVKPASCRAGRKSTSECPFDSAIHEGMLLNVHYLEMQLPWYARGVSFRRIYTATDGKHELLSFNKEVQRQMAEKDRWLWSFAIEQLIFLGVAFSLIFFNAAKLKRRETHRCQQQAGVTHDATSSLKNS